MLLKFYLIKYAKLQFSKVTQFLRLDTYLTSVKSDYNGFDIQGPPYLWQRTFYGDSQEKGTKLNIYCIKL